MYPIVIFGSQTKHRRVGWWKTVVDAFGGSMAEVVAEGTSFLSAADREAIATYLLDPEGTGDIPAPAPTPVETPMAGMDHSQMDMGNGN